ncbi:hypothetical protein KMW28_04780 [Flammeovirga yaeyamensis]|uniref:HTH tetR-type domain-containing protein n=1 Tax=Flammeovirga yaeyamensis TaxID=367791 RepID=A0AAX1NA74_9BACT|nr:hypothetical protein [Flammeovirga yaeyamensis]MBB3697471.1 AcrR family transcriptional regulator [Flammeovirga yaeyamensis]NMF36165.1 hypothetical protein [Flammeovirga yaeyamensis]QWG02898.1 hypothetical protein KMW28_04780 [Flammeovirga yaeyamensis]
MKIRKNAAPTKEAMIEMSIKYIEDKGEWSLRKLASYCGTTTKVFYTRFEGEEGLVEAIINFIGKKKAQQYKSLEQSIRAFYFFEQEFYKENKTILEFLSSRGKGANPFTEHLREPYLNLFNGDINKVIFAGTVMLGVQALMSKGVPLDHDVTIGFLEKGIE